MGAMKRWIIRSLFICLLLTATCSWWKSYTYPPFSDRIPGPHTRVCINNGMLFVVFPWFGMSSKLRPLDTGFYCNEIDALNFRFGYFGERHGSDVAQFRFVAVPFWLLTPLSAILLWLVWRKTRPKVKGRAFPVELKQPSG